MLFFCIIHLQNLGANVHKKFIPQIFCRKITKKIARIEIVITEKKEIMPKY
jgi:hypothetical protein